MGNLIEQSICEAVDIIVDRAISRAGFDKTITALIVECIDEVAGKYKVKYQDSFYYATSDSSVTYNVNSEVYILIPNGDFSKDKKIIGTVKALGTNYVSLIEGDEGYEYIGTNVIDEHEKVLLCSYNENTSILLYDADAQTQLLNIDIAATEEYLKQSSHVIIGGEFKTSLPKEQRNYGNYGLIFTLEFLDEAYQESIYKDFIIDIDNMIGQPYNFTTFTRQIEGFEINSSQFVRIKSISAFAENFPKKAENKPNDIFIQNIELIGGVKINSTSLDSYYLSLLTPQGTFFPKDTKLEQLTLKAEVKIRGKVIDFDIHNVKFYWFIEHSGVNSKHPFFCSYGGQGWKCLNNYNIISAVTNDKGEVISPEFVEWIPEKEFFYVKKEEMLARQAKYKCVCVYDDSIVLTKEILIKNNNANYNITIDSSNGTSFMYDQGSTTLTCQVDSLEKLEYNYYWAKKNNIGNYEYLNDTDIENQLYEEAQLLKEEIEKSFNENKYYPEQESQINNNKYKTILGLLEQYYLEKGYTYDELYKSVVNYVNDSFNHRICKNIIHNLPVKTITDFATYSCSVFKIEKDGSESYIGTASVKITNSFEEQPSYSLIINNGTQVFKYNEAGLSPAHESNERPLSLPTLSFTLFDENGNMIEEEVLKKSCEIKWKIPLSDTHLISNIQNTDFIEEDGYRIYRNILIFDFLIALSYNVNRNRNDIELEVKYRDKVLKAKTNFTFLKEGDSGTNGTNIVCKIVPNTKDKILPPYPLITYTINNSSFEIEMNYNIKSEDGNASGTNAKKYSKWFKVQMWKDGEEIDLDISAVKWSFLKNKYSSSISDTELFTVTEDGTFEMYPNRSYPTATSYGHIANIVKAVITYDDKEYIATLPIAVRQSRNLDYRVEIEQYSGFRYVVYSSDGMYPQYDITAPFKAKVQKYKDNTWVDCSLDDDISYTWRTHGYLYNKKTEKWEICNLITAFGEPEIKNEKKFQPASTYDGQCVTVAVEALVYKGTEANPVCRIFYPIHYMFNRYGLSALNGWDGNSISLNDSGGMILAPQVGAGKKETDNSFTGIVIGEVNDPNDKANKVGLLGYHKGQRSIFLDSETGRAEFGKQGAGQIIIDPSGDDYEAVITSGNYDEVKGEGMEINLTTPSIKFANGYFSVDSEGGLIAKGTGNIAGWKISNNSLTCGDVGMASTYSSGTTTEDGKPIHYNFWAGNSEPSKSSFYVCSNGYIKASYGTIGGWSINSKDIYTKNLTKLNTDVPEQGSVRLSSSTFPATIANQQASSWRFNIGPNFGVTQDGNLHAAGGRIAGWTIDSDSLSTGPTTLEYTDANGKSTTSETPPKSGTIKLSKKKYGAQIKGASLTNLRFSIGSDFGVTEDGTIYSRGGIFEEARINSLYIGEEKVAFAWQSSDVVTGATLSLNTTSKIFTMFTDISLGSYVDANNKPFVAFQQSPGYQTGVGIVTGGDIVVHTAPKYFLTLTAV